MPIFRMCHHTFKFSAGSSSRLPLVEADVPGTPDAASAYAPTLCLCAVSVVSWGGAGY
jgi:hypothetical protein